MVLYEFKVTVSEDATFADRWLFAVWERRVNEDGTRGEWSCLRRKLATYNAWRKHSRADLRDALRSLL